MQHDSCCMCQWKMMDFLIENKMNSKPAKMKPIIHPSDDPSNTFVIVRNTYTYSYEFSIHFFIFFPHENKNKIEWKVIRKLLKQNLSFSINILSIRLMLHKCFFGFYFSHSIRRYNRLRPDFSNCRIRKALVTQKMIILLS